MADGMAEAARDDLTIVRAAGGLVVRDGKVLLVHRPKTVRYWRMRALDGEFVPHDEVDEIAWETPEDAAGRLSWPRDLPLLERL